MKFNKLRMVAALAMLSLMVGCQSASAEYTTPPTAVEVAGVKLSVIQNEILFAGQIQPYDSVTVVSKSSGKVKQSFFDVGDAVTEGDVMFMLDEEDINNQITQLQAQLAQAQVGVLKAQSDLSKVTGGSYQSSVLQQETGIETYKSQVESAKVTLSNAEVGIKNAKNAVDNAEVALKNTGVTIDSYEVAVRNAEVVLDNAQLNLDTCKTNLDNATVLYNSGVMTKKEFDAADSAYKAGLNALEQAKNGLISARNNLEQGKNSVTAAENTYEQAQNGYESALNSYTQAQIGLETAETALLQAQKSLGLTEGQITAENRQTAQFGVASAEASVEILLTQLQTTQTSLNNLTVTAPMTGVISSKGVNANEYTSPASAAYTIIESNTVKVNVKASELIINSIAVGDEIDVYIKGVQQEAFVGRIATISPNADQTNTYPITIEIDNNDGRIKAGMFAEVHMVLEQSFDTVVLPVNTVLRSDTNNYVYVNDGNTAKRVIVETGITDGKNIEILTGLSENDQVIVKGQSFLTDGQKINVVASAESIVLAGEE